MLVRRLASIVTLAIAVAGCANAGVSASPPPTGGSSLAPATTATATATHSPTAESSAASGQTDTEWGRIWDTVPADFPTFAGTTPAEEAATGPASATRAAPGNVAAAVATWMAGRLTAAGYTVDGATSALEDGSYVLDARRDPGCRVGVTVAPAGGMTTITVLYGAGCPKP